jgi:uncharacterized protein YqeY
LTSTNGSQYEGLFLEAGLSIADEVTTELKNAMRARDSQRTTALRGIRAAFITIMKADGAGVVSDEAAVAALRRLAKQRIESIAAFDKGGRDDLAAAERAELAVIEQWLPKLADEETTRQWVAAAIAESGAASMGDLGRVMGALMRAHKGEVDGKLAQKVARDLLG